MSKTVSIIAFIALVASLVGLAVAVRLVVASIRKGWADLKARLRLMAEALRKGEAVEGYRVVRCEDFGENYYEVEIVGTGYERRGIFRVRRWHDMIIALGNPEIGWTSVGVDGTVDTIHPQFIPLLRKAVLRELWADAGGRKADTPVKGEQKAHEEAA